MGNIKQTFIKRVGEEIYGAYKDRISRDFDKNKEFLNELIESRVLICKSNRLRNRLAGYLTTKKDKKLGPRIRIIQKSRKRKK